MSVTEYDVICPRCRKKWKHIFPRSVDVEEEPEMKEKVLSGDIFALMCPHCGTETGVLFPLLYHDPGRRIMIQLIEEDESDPFAGALGAMQNDDELLEHAFRRSYVMRIVSDPNALTEKILLLESGRDDRAAEILKAHIISEGGMPEIRDLLYSPSDTQAVFVVESDEGFIGEMPFDEDAYNDIRSKVLPLLSADTLNSHRIDAEWAVKAILEADAAFRKNAQ